LMVFNTLKIRRIKRPVNLDIVGALLLSISIGALMVALENGADRGWGSGFVLALLALAIIVGGVYWFHERRTPEPITPPRLMANDIVRMSLVLGFLMSSVMMTVGLFYSLYFQNAKLYSPTQAGLRGLPQMIGLTIASTLTGRYITKSGSYKRTPLFGIPMMFVGLMIGYFTMRNADVSSSSTYPILAISLACIGVGMGATMPTASISIQNAAELKDLGAATSMGNFFRNLGSAIGLALFGALFNVVVRSALRTNLPPSLREGDVFSVIRTPKKIAALPDEARDAVTKSIAIGSSRVLLFAAGVTVLTFISALLLREVPLRTSNEPMPAAAE
jgi:hypothetical protein